MLVVADYYNRYIKRHVRIYLGEYKYASSLYNRRNYIFNNLFITRYKSPSSYNNKHVFLERKANTLKFKINKIRVYKNSFDYLHNIEKTVFAPSKLFDFKFLCNQLSGPDVKDNNKNNNNNIDIQEIVTIN